MLNPCTWPVRSLDEGGWRCGRPVAPGCTFCRVHDGKSVTLPELQVKAGDVQTPDKRDLQRQNRHRDGF